MSVSNEKIGHSMADNLPLISIIFLSFCYVASSFDEVSFLQCFSLQANSTSKTTTTRDDPTYTSLLQSTIQNLRFLNTSIPDPQLIVSPIHPSHIQAAIVCSQKHGVRMRVRSGGHDYEGLSYVSEVPFILIDPMNMRSVAVDVEQESAWVESGATIGELYYEISQKSEVLGFSAGTCPTVGVGGHVSGGGFGRISRKYGLASDNVIDAKMVDVNGKVLDRKSMGEDLFWAIRGGGGASFGVIFAWKMKLVHVPPTVTVFELEKNIEENATMLLYKWQNIAHKLQEDLLLDAYIGVVTPSSSLANKTINISFRALYLGGIEKILPLIQESFPELGLTRESCMEMSWIQSVLYFRGFSQDESTRVLLNRTQPSKSFYKAKSDYVTTPIPETALQGLWSKLIEYETCYMILSPYGGVMSQISDSETPFPHRSGNMYKIQYMVTWDSEEESSQHINWMRELYDYMAPYVSRFPRAAFLNYRDLDLGRNNNDNNTSYAEASVWGLKYFKSNFRRLAEVKTASDPTNFFRNEQSIPVLSPRSR
ncbi:tetrahydroberberine oxidase-like [Syzygium oleosum]|uniref:tetrahydroberberine oxidase-like n=1 Tax=Syzygium oleosum TaxID=219896 RepID=UPI0024BAB72E|nr:tetrahydroberberine oxidase-like [Syzygium oleosum]